jgi:hypothetical protein
MSSKPHPITHVSCASALSSAHESAEVGISPPTTIIRDKIANAIEDSTASPPRTPTTRFRLDQQALSCFLLSDQCKGLNKYSEKSQ